MMNRTTTIIISLYPIATSRGDALDREIDGRVNRQTQAIFGIGDGGSKLKAATKAESISQRYAMTRHLLTELEKRTPHNYEQEKIPRLFYHPTWLATLRNSNLVKLFHTRYHDTELEKAMPDEIYDCPSTADNPYEAVTYAECFVVQETTHDHRITGSRQEAAKFCFKYLRKSKWISKMADRSYDCMKEGIVQLLATKNVSLCVDIWKNYNSRYLGVLMYSDFGHVLLAFENFSDRRETATEMADAIGEVIKQHKTEERVLAITFDNFRENPKALYVTFSLANNVIGSRRINLGDEKLLKLMCIVSFVNSIPELQKLEHQFRFAIEDEDNECPRMEIEDMSDV
ncbi:hypothetical protein OGAPHI_007102 [Ogataea philodendri]|uniref:Uncharacterized protein n=1 Tax=Ogataea philodendri TaxID=1378263 RepID=A0A9P8T0E5_9ASCO|nr:uncharacterized protein OGAPHI_007102 [Ogataea philodendri]KAH3660516.1 hypothetical protein OGAPHI_007102 [Ogataea philodendri]